MAESRASMSPAPAPSSWHGVTTILFGNCGVGFAAVRREHRTARIELMGGVEDIPVRCWPKVLSALIVRIEDAGDRPA